MRRMVVAAASVGAVGLLAGCSGATEPGAIGPTHDVSAALAAYEPSLEGYTLDPAHDAGNDVYLMSTAGELEQMPSDALACAVFDGAHALTIADDPTGFPDDVGVDYGRLARTGEDDADGYELRVRQFATPELPVQLAQTVLDGAAACAGWEPLDVVAGETWDGLEDVTAEAVTLEGVPGSAVRVGYTVTRHIARDGEGASAVTDGGYLGLIFMYPYGRIMARLSAPRDADLAEVATILADLVAAIDAG